MIATVHSATLKGTAGSPVVVEVHISGGLPGFSIVGLPDAAVRESRDRVRAALLSSGFAWPQQRVTVNLAPSGLPKSGAGLDLAIALGVLLAEGALPPSAAADVAFVGELGLDGSLRHVPGAIALADAVLQSRLVVPLPDEAEAAAVRPGSTVGMAGLRPLTDVLRGLAPWPATSRPGRPQLPCDTGNGGTKRPFESEDRLRRVVARHGDLADVKGQRVGRRAVEVAAAGGHHLLLVGPPGSGKTMLARRLAGLLPPLTRAQAVEVTRVRSAAGRLLPESGLCTDPPFRAPHHGASAVSLVGGGTAAMRPGEISLATNGVLFLDEMGEFSPSVLEALREPLEEGVVRVSRARGTVDFPARFLLVAATNPCPCGEGGTPGACRCSPAARARYVRRLSGPLLDRFDLVVPLRRTPPEELLAPSRSEPTATVAGRVAMARALARGVCCNARLESGDLDAAAPLSPDAARLLAEHVRAGRLTGRGVDRVRRVARTIADLARVAPDSAGEDAVPPGGAGRAVERSAVVEAHHVAEALALRAGREVLDVAA